MVETLLENKYIAKKENNKLWKAQLRKFCGKEWQLLPGV
jgi:hypothetical protein